MKRPTSHHPPREPTQRSHQDKADEWSERSRLRTEEMDSIDRALEILDNDDAHALFNKAIKPGQEFTQVGVEGGSTAVET